MHVDKVYKVVLLCLRIKNGKTECLLITSIGLLDWAVADAVNRLVDREHVVFVHQRLKCVIRLVPGARLLLLQLYGKDVLFFIYTRRDVRAEPTLVVHEAISVDFLENVQAFYFFFRVKLRRAPYNGAVREHCDHVLFGNLY